MIFYVENLLCVDTCNSQKGRPCGFGQSLWPIYFFFFDQKKIVLQVLQLENENNKNNSYSTACQNDMIHALLFLAVDSHPKNSNTEVTLTLFWLVETEGLEYSDAPSISMDRNNQF